MKRLLVLMALGFPWGVRAEMVDRVAAVVNSDIVALSEIEQRVAPEMARINSERDPKKRAAQRTELQKKALDVLIGEKLLEAQIKELNIEVTEQDIDAGMEDVRRQNNLEQAQFEQLLRQEGYTLPAYRDFMRKHLARLKLINLKVRSKVKVSDEELKAEYAKYSRMEGEESEVHARHIVMTVGPKATTDEIEKARLRAVAIAAEARKANVDFAELAKAKSEGPSKSDGGDLGYFRRGVMIPEFERTSFGMKVGEVSDPVRTKFGWHVIKVEDRRSIPAKPFEEVKEQLKDSLLKSQLERYTDQYVQELRQSAVVETKI
ncbi:MAG: peptidylprolyl isomerase [Myxococcaceae bacterium]